MEIKLHSNATTTPKIRAYLQKSDKSDTELAQELGISVQTVKRWRYRQDVNDRSHVPNKINRTLSFEQEYLLCYLRQHLNLSLDEVLQVTQDLINRKASRAVISRSLKKYQLNKINKKDNLLGQTYLEIIKLPKALSKEAQYLLILIEKSTGYISFACLDHTEERQKNIIEYFNTALPYKIKQIELNSQAVNFEIAQQLCNKIIYSNNIIEAQNELNFNQDFIKIVDGNYTDSRLGFDAQLLRYEEYLNKQLKRVKLKRSSPNEYLQNKK